MNENMKTPLFKEIPTMVENIANQKEEDTDIEL
jgi:hypothetical protein